MLFLKNAWKRLAESRTAWALVASLIVIILRAVLPSFPISDEVLGSSLMLLISFTVAEGLEGYRPSPAVFQTLFKSRKFWLTISAIVVAIATSVSPDFPFREEQVLSALNWVIALIFGVGIEGAVEAMKVGKPRG